MARSLRPSVRRWPAIRGAPTAGERADRDTVTRQLRDLPVAGCPLVLLVAIPGYRCTAINCARVMFNQELGKLAAARKARTRRRARYVLRRLMIDRTTTSAIATELGVAWHTVSSIAIRAVGDLAADAGAQRLSGVRVMGIDEHRWARRRRGADGFVTLGSQRSRRWRATRYTALTRTGGPPTTHRHPACLVEMVRPTLIPRPPIPLPTTP